MQQLYLRITSSKMDLLLAKFPQLAFLFTKKFLTFGIKRLVHQLVNISEFINEFLSEFYSTERLQKTFLQQ